MKLIKLLLLMLVCAFTVSSASGQANASINVLTLNGGQVNQGSVVDVQVTVGNTGPTSSIGVNKVRAQVSIPIAIASALPNAGQTGLPTGWIILSNTGGVITVCNGSDIIPVGQQRQIFIKVQGNAVGGPSTVSGQLSFGPGTAVCTGLGSLGGNLTADDISQSTIQVLPAPACNLSVSASAGIVACNGGTTTLTATPSGAVGSIEYSITGGAPFQSSNQFTVPAGTYTVTAREVSTPACSATSSPVTVSEPAAISASASAGSSTICDGATTTLTVIASGGTGSLEYSLNGGAFQAGNTFAVGVGTHTVTVRDANLCTASTVPVTVSASPSITASAAAGAPILCNGGSTTLTVTASGGTGALEYSLNGGAFQASNTFSVGAGTYTATVRDASLCTATAAPVTVSQPSAVTVNGSVTTPIPIPGGTGTITVSAVGGTGTKTYVISSGTTINTTGATSGVFSNLLAGNYVFTATDANGCTGTASVTLSNPVAGNANASINVLTLNSGQVNLGGVVDVQVTVSNTGPSFIVGNKVRAQLSIPIAIASALPNAGQTGLPPGWTILSNTGGVITVCNGSDIIPAGQQRQILIKVQGNAVGGPSTVSGQLSFGPGTGVCTGLGSQPGDLPADNVSQSTIQVVSSCSIGVSASAGTIACNGGTTTLTAVATGAVGAVEYSLNGGAFQSGNTFTVNAAGSPYTVTAREVNTPACSATSASVVVSQPAQLVAAETHTAVLCFGGSSTVTISATGGTAPYTGTGSFTQAAGTQSYTVTDANGCSSSVSVTVTQPAQLVAAESHTAILCFGGSSTVTISATGGTAPYTGTGSFTQSAGTQSYTVTDANGCSSSVSVTVTQPAQLVAAESHTAVLCFGGSSTVTISATGGTAPYTGTGSFIQSAGTQSYTVTDANGCSSSVSVTVTQPSALSASASSTPVTTIGGSNGTATATVSGGTSPYSYSWAPGGQTTATATGLTAGSYTVTVTDANGCIASATTTVGSPACNINLSFTQVNVLCFGATSGSATVTAVNTSGSVSYLWSNGQTTATATGLAAGNYNVTVTDGAGCTASGSVTITQPAQLVAAESHTAVLCFGGSSTVTISATGGTAPYTGTGSFTQAAGTQSYTVTDANGCSSSVSVTVTQPAQLVAAESHTAVLCFGGSSTVTISATGGTAPYTGTGSFTQAAGTQSYTVTDANGCSSSVSVTVTQPAQLVAAESHTAVLCFGGSSTVTISATGGTAPYTGTGSFTQAAGTQSYTVTDANGCSSSVSVTVTQPAQLVAAESHTAILCFGGSSTVTISATGGTAPYTGTGSFTQSAGTQSYTVTDANGCSSSVSVTVTQPSALSASASSTPVTTIGGSNGTATATVSGGTSPYSYSWAPGGQTTATATGLTAGSYTVTVTDANGCIASATTTVGSPACNINLSFTQVNVLCFGASSGSATVTAVNTSGSVSYLWSNGQTTATATGLAAGTYSVTVTDGAGCTASGSVTITQPAQLVAAESHTAVLCFGGSSTVTISATGGTAPYTGTGSFTQAAGTQSYTVTDANGCSSSVSVTVTQPAQLVAAESHTAVLCFGGSSTVTISATGGTAPYTGTGSFTQAAGTQSYTVTDANGCSSSVSVTVTQPAQLVAAESHTAVLCFGGSSTVTISATGGTAPYTGTGSFTQAAGTQSYTVTDANGCSSSVSVTVTQPAQLVAAESHTAILCFGGSSTVTISATGGTAPYTGTGSFTQSAGTQSYTVTDANGCSSSVSVTVTQPSALSASASSTPVTTIGGSNGTATATVSGGTSPYSYSWAPGGQTTATATGLTAGSYTVTVTDANGCIASATTTVGSPACNINLSFTQVNVLCFGATSGSATVTAVNTTGSVSYLWSNGQTTATATGLAAGNYNVTVTDGAGCTASGSVTITQPSQLVASSAASPILCFGGSTSVEVTANGGTAPYTGTGSFNRTAGTYSFTVTDANGCTAVTTITIAPSSASAVVVSASATVIACTNGTSTVTISATGGTAPYTGTGTFTRTAGTYSFTVTDANGCTGVRSITITQPPLLFASSSAPAIALPGGSTTVTVSATGGTAPYTGTGTFVRTAGTYTFTVTDSRGCIATTSITLSDPVAGPANASINLLTLNGGQVNQGSVVDVQVTVGNTGPSFIGVNKVRAQISIPIAIASALPNALQTGLPAGWIILSNTGGVITICNGSDYIAANTQRQIFIKVQGNSPGGPSTISGQLNFGPGTGVCTGPGTLSGDLPADNISQSTIVVIGNCNLGVTASAGTIACNGGTTILTAVATGASGSVEYSLNGGAFQPSNTFTVNAAGSPYTVTAREVENPTCTAAAPAVTVTQPAQLVAAESHTAVLCFGGSSTVTISATGGTAPYTGTGSFTQSAGTQSYTVTDANGCSSSVSVTVTQPAQLVAAETHTAVLCFGGSSTVTISATGGTAPYTGTGSFIQSAGTQSYTVTDANGCSSSVSVTVTQPSALSASASSTPVTTIGGSNGTATATVSGGTSPYSYSWAPGGQTTATATGLTAGSYTVTVTDANGCIASATTTVGSPACNINLSFTQVNVLCFGATSGSATVTAVNTSGSVSYLWSNGQTTATATGLAAGNYNVTVTDGAGCTASGSVTITQPAQLVAAESHTAVLCFGGSSTVTISATGGTAPYTGTGSFTQAAGTQSYTVTDANGCSSSVSVTVTEPALLVANSSATTIACFGGSSTVTVSATGGTAPYTGTGSFTQAAGTQSYTVTDANGCTSSVSVTVTQPSAVPAPTVDVVQPTCAVVTGTITITSATAGLTFSLDGGAYAAYPAAGYVVPAGSHTLSARNAAGCISALTTVNVNAQPATPAAPTVNVVQPTCAVATGTITITSATAGLTFSLDGGAYAAYPAAGYVVPAGSHTLSARNAAGCISALTTVTVNAQPATPAAPTVNVVQPTCAVATGTITITSATVGLTFSLDGGAYAAHPAAGYVVPAGSHTLSARNAAGCISALTTVTVNAQPASPSVSAVAGIIACFGGTTTLTATGSGGTAPYQYSLNGGAFQAANTFTVSAGSYTVTVRDANNCTGTTTGTVIQPVELAVTASSTAATTGSNGTATANPSGGTAPYSYLWNPGGQTTQTATGLSAAVYTVTVTDSRGCTASATVTVGTGGCSITVNLGPDKDLCNGPVVLTPVVNGAVTSGPAPLQPFTEVAGSNADTRIFSGNIDHITIGNTFSQSEDRNNCGKLIESSKTLNLPAGAIIKKAYLYWSGSGSLDDKIKISNAGGTSFALVSAENTKTYSRSGGFSYFGARADITSLVSGSGTYVVKDLNWNNGSPYCYDNSAYGGWIMTVVYEQPTLPSVRIHINTEKFQFTYPSATYSTTINNISVPAGCSADAELTIGAFEGDNYKGERLRIAGVLDADDNNFRGQAGPNLDIITKNAPSIVGGTTSLTYSIESFQSNTIFGQAIEGLFDYVKVLKYKNCPPSCSGVRYLWSNGATTPTITVSNPGSYSVRVTDCAGCVKSDTINVAACAPVDPNKCYKLIVRHSGKAATVTGSSIANGGNVEQRTYSGSSNQIWKFAEVEPGFYKVSNENSGKVLEVAGASTQNGANVQQWSWLSANNQKWSLTPTGSYYAIKAKHSNKTMSVAGSSGSNGANIEQRGSGSNYNEQWSIVEVGCPSIVKGIETPPSDVKAVVVAGELSVNVLPNPSRDYFTLIVKGSDLETPVSVKIMDVNGKLLSTHKTGINTSLKVGEARWTNGTYFAEVIQGDQRKVVRLIKAD